MCEVVVSLASLASICPSSHLALSFLAVTPRRDIFKVPQLSRHLMAREEAQRAAVLAGAPLALLGVRGGDAPLPTARVSGCAQ